MTAAVGHPTLRLVRVAVGPWDLLHHAPRPGDTALLQPADFAFLLV